MPVSSKLSYLTMDQMQLIHEKALEVLSEIGVEVSHLAALRQLEGAGAKVDFNAQTVKFPADLVESCLLKSPRNILLAARTPEQDIALEPFGSMYTRNTGGMSSILDYLTSQIRDITLQDVAVFTRLIDGLRHFDIQAPIYAEDVPLSSRELQVLKCMLNNTTKHINIRAFDVRALPYLARIGEIVAGGSEALRQRPVISLMESPITPLKFPEIFVETLYTAGAASLPIEICSTPIIGATSPITLAGSLLMSIVEQLAANVIGQVAYPGMKIIWAPRFPAMDMATGNTTIVIECAIVSAAAAEMIKYYYGFVCDLYGPVTNAVVTDQESFLENGYTGLVTALSAKPSILCGGGALEAGRVASLEELVIGSGILGIAKQTLKGLEIETDTLSKEMFDFVGSRHGGWRNSHQLKHYTLPKFYNSAMLDKWTVKGSQRNSKIIREKIQRILLNHHPEPLPEEINRMIDEVIREATLSDPRAEKS